nr:hypothetical protein [Nonomuraea gerenzanensis]
MTRLHAAQRDRHDVGAERARCVAAAMATASPVAISSNLSSTASMTGPSGAGLPSGLGSMRQNASHSGSGCDSRGSGSPAMSSSVTHCLPARRWSIETSSSRGSSYRTVTSSPPVARGGRVTTASARWSSRAARVSVQVRYWVRTSASGCRRRSSRTAGVTMRPNV